MEMGA